MALVLNFKTGHVSPQYYLTVDDEFSTVSQLNINASPPNWIQLFLSYAECLEVDESLLAVPVSASCPIDFSLAIFCFRMPCLYCTINFAQTTQGIMWAWRIT